MTNINSHAPGKWLVNDSQFAMFDLKALKPSLSYIQSRPGRFEVYKVNMQQQRGVYDCGLFAIASAYELCSGNNLEKIEFEQSKMHVHYQQCLVNNRLTAFPQSIRNTEPKYELHRIKRG